MNSGLREYHLLFTNLMQEVANCTPAEWDGGVFTINRNSPGIKCSITNRKTSENATLSQQLLSLCDAYLGFKQEYLKNDWVKATIPYSMGQYPGDFSTDGGSFEYPDDLESINRLEVDLLDEDFWREETKNEAWKQSPSLLVIELILDYGSAFNMQRNQDFSQLTSESIFSQDILRKFTSSKKSLSIDNQYFNYNHRINLELVQSAESQNNKALVITNFQEESEGININFEYMLEFHNNRWFLVDIAIRR